MLGCMMLGGDRTHQFELSTGQKLDTVGFSTTAPTPQQTASATARYELKKGDRISNWQESDPIIFAEYVLHTAKRIL